MRREHRFLTQVSFLVSLFVFIICPLKAEAQVTEVYDGNKLYYQFEDGTYANEHWEKLDGEWYYMDTEDNKIKDNVIVAYDDKYYVFDEDGKMLRSQTIFKNGLSYVIDASGAAVPEPTEEELILQEYAKEVVAQFTNDSMTVEEKCQAIYNNLYAGFVYDQTNETDLNTVESGMKAFDLRSGNCYVLFAKAHYLLQAIGVKDMLVTCCGDYGEPIDHWWGMVKIGDKYRHMDSVIFTEVQKNRFMTTEEFMETSKSDGQTYYLHQYNQTNFPKAY